VENGFLFSMLSSQAVISTACGSRPRFPSERGRCIELFAQGLTKIGGHDAMFGHKLLQPITTHAKGHKIVPQSPQDNRAQLEPCDKGFGSGLAQSARTFANAETKRLRLALPLHGTQ
jgi:hypothetical protein